MVGSVLMQRMQEEQDFSHIEPVFFSTSNAGGKAPAMAKNENTLKDANDIESLKKCDIILTCQGGDYTTEIYPKLRAAGWNGYWIDAASTLRMKEDAIIVLDPVNLDVIKGAWSTTLDPTSYPAEDRRLNARVVIDACRPWLRRDTFPKVARNTAGLDARLRAKWAQVLRGY